MAPKEPFTFVTQTSVTSEAPPDAVFSTIADLRAHLEWSGERAADATFKLLAIEQTSDGDLRVGATFESTGANFNGTFHDRSTIAVMSSPSVFVIETDGTGSRITYTETISRLNYIPYWLRLPLRPLSRVIIDRGDEKQLRNLAELAAERAAGSA